MYIVFERSFIIGQFSVMWFRHTWNVVFDISVSGSFLDLCPLCFYVYFLLFYHRWQSTWENGVNTRFTPLSVWHHCFCLSVLPLSLSLCSRSLSPVKHINILCWYEINILFEMFIVSVKRYLNGANSAHMILPSLCFSAGMSRLHFIVLFLRNPHYSVLTNVDFFFFRLWRF